MEEKEKKKQNDRGKREKKMCHSLPVISLETPGHVVTSGKTEILFEMGVALNPVISHVALSFYIKTQISLWILNNASILITEEIDPVESLT